MLLKDKIKQELKSALLVANDEKKFSEILTGYKNILKFQSTLNMAESEFNGLLDELVEVTQQDGTTIQATLLYIAALKNIIISVDELLAEKVTVDKAMETYNFTPLSIAAQAGNTDVVKRLLAAKANIDHQVSWGGTPLYLAAKYGNVATVQALIAVDADLNIPTTDNGDTPLHIAVKKGYLEVVKLLVDGGADLNPINKFEDTPLALASSCKFDDKDKADANLEIIKFLIEKGSNVNRSGKFFGIAAMWRAVQNKHSEALRLLLKAKNANVNQRNKHEETLLHLAAKLNYCEGARILLLAGADVNLTSYLNMIATATPNITTINVAVYYGHHQIIKLFIAAKPDLSEKTDHLIAALAKNSKAKLILDIAEVLLNFNLIKVPATTDEEITDVVNRLDAVLFYLYGNQFDEFKDKKDDDDFYKQHGELLFKFIRCAIQSSIVKNVPENYKIKFNKTPRAQILKQLERTDTDQEGVEILLTKVIAPAIRDNNGPFSSDTTKQFLADLDMYERTLKRLKPNLPHQAPKAEVDEFLNNNLPEKPTKEIATTLDDMSKEFAEKALKKSEKLDNENAVPVEPPSTCKIDEYTSENEKKWQKMEQDAIAAGLDPKKEKVLGDQPRYAVDKITEKIMGKPVMPKPLVPGTRTTILDEHTFKVKLAIIKPGEKLIDDFTKAELTGEYDICYDLIEAIDDVVGNARKKVDKAIKKQNERLAQIKNSPLPSAPSESEIIESEPIHGISHDANASAPPVEVTDNTKPASASQDLIDFKGDSHVRTLQQPSIEKSIEALLARKEKEDAKQQEVKRVEEIEDQLDALAVADTTLKSEVKTALTS